MLIGCRPASPRSRSATLSGHFDGVGFASASKRSLSVDPATAVRAVHCPLQLRPVRDAYLDQLKQDLAMKGHRWLLTAAMFSLSLGLAACQMQSPRSQASATLYQQVGGQAGVATVVEGLLQRVHSDTRLNGLFENTDLADLKRLVEEQLCAAMGGPCSYSGRDMEEAHSGLAITDQEFDWFVEHLVASMTAAGVAPAQQTDILGLLGPMRPQIVGQ